MSFAGFLCLLPASKAAAAKPILAHYMPWYVCQPQSNVWGWHWTLNHFRPGALDNQGRQQIASHFYPQVGPYDSLDSAVLEYHVLLMKLAGVDGVIVDWYGMDAHNDYAINNERTLALFECIRKANLRFALCFEDAVIRREVESGFVKSDDALGHAGEIMRYAESKFFTDPSYLRLSNAPVLLNFGPQYFKKSSDWSAIFAGLRETNRPALFTEDVRLSAGVGAFNWPPMWMSGGGTNQLTSAQLTTYLDKFEKESASWPAFISSAFPRFQDIYGKTAQRSSYGSLADAAGATFRTTLERALTNKSTFVQLVTWNDFEEGTVIEPTAEFGTRDLAIVQELRRRHIDPSFNTNTNSLQLAARYFTLRKRSIEKPSLASGLEEVFRRITSGDITQASLKLTALESGQSQDLRAAVGTKAPEFALGGATRMTNFETRVSALLTNAPAVNASTAFGD